MKANVQVRKMLILPIIGYILIPSSGNGSNFPLNFRTAYRDILVLSPLNSQQAIWQVYSSRLFRLEFNSQAYTPDCFAVHTLWVLVDFIAHNCRMIGDNTAVSPFFAID